MRKSLFSALAAVLLVASLMAGGVPPVKVAGAGGGLGLDIPLSVSEVSGMTRLNEPVSSGVPLPYKGSGVQFSTDALTVLDEQGVPQPAQFKVLARWFAPVEDNLAPIRVVLVSLVADFEAGQERVFRLTDSGLNPVLPALGRESGGQVEVDTGKLRAVFDEGQGTLFSSLSWWDDRELLDEQGKSEVVLKTHNSEAYHSSELKPTNFILEENGPVRAVVLAEVNIPDIVNGHISYSIRYYFYRQVDMVRMSFTLKNTGRGEDEDTDKMAIEDLDWLRLEELRLDLPMSLGGDLSLAHDGYRGGISDGENYRLHQYHQTVDIDDESKNFFYQGRLDGNLQASGSRSAGWLDLGNGERGITIGTRNFWQKYPNALQASADKLSFELFPADGAYPVPDDPVPGTDYFGLHPVNSVEGAYNILGGQFHNNDIFIRLYTGAGGSQGAGRHMETLDRPLMAAVPSGWWVTTGAAGLMAPLPGDITLSEQGEAVGHEEIRAAMDRHLTYSRTLFDPAASKDEVPGRAPQGATFRSYMQERRTDVFTGTDRPLYGKFNYGDIPWGGGYSNQHYDWSGSTLRNFARTGDYGYFETGRMLADFQHYIGGYHHDDPSNNRLFTHGFARYESSYWHGLGRMKPLPTHSWSEGLLWYYFLTGDAHFLDGIIERADASMRYPYGWLGAEIRGHGWGALQCLNAYKATGQAAYKDRALQILKDMPDPAEVSFFLMHNYVAYPLTVAHYETNDAGIAQIIAGMADHLRESLQGGHGSTEEYYIFHLDHGNPDQKHPILNLFIADFFAYNYLVNASADTEDNLSIARHLFKDGWSYFDRGDDKQPVEKGALAPMNFFVSGFPNTTSKVGGWLLRTGPAYLFTEYAAGGGIDTLPGLLETGGPPAMPDECFIATAAFGSKMAPAVVLLRQFRDARLLKNSPGQALVRFYYANSPALAGAISGNEILKTAARALLLPVISLAWMLMNVEVALAMAIMAMKVILASALAQAGDRASQGRFLTCPPLNGTPKIPGVRGRGCRHFLPLLERKLPGVRQGRKP